MQKDEQAEQELEPEIKYFFNSSSQMFLLIVETIRNGLVCLSVTGFVIILLAST
ncbi:MAG: hypothetical protein QOK59_05230 [Nitrososphaeraceae archaeon]|nr:hypothetical protein [Nitrososphaeraceae archaeon]MDW0148072.1 hypothetical protein [Nitrososphaeraceae archaeon]MDW0152193.1 hypothetical protein [Nitrososphaeraceae archaeon]